MTATCDHNALSNPRKVLTPSQQDALTAIGFFRFQKQRAGGWAIGNKRFNASTIEALRAHGFLTKFGGKLHLTQTGSLAVDKLKGQTQ